MSKISSVYIRVQSQIIYLNLESVQIYEFQIFVTGLRILMTKFEGPTSPRIFPVAFLFPHTLSVVFLTHSCQKKILHTTVWMVKKNSTEMSLVPRGVFRYISDEDVRKRRNC